MARFEFTTMIDRPPEDVFIVLVDFEHEHEWNPVVIEAKHLFKGPVGVGATILQVARMLGRRVESTLEVTQYEPNEKVALRLVSGFGASLDGEAGQQLQPLGGGTKLTTFAQGHLRGVLRPLTPLMFMAMRSELQTAMRRMKQALEARANPEPRTPAPGG